MQKQQYVLFDGCSSLLNSEAAGEEHNYILLRKHNSFSVVLLKSSLLIRGKPV